MKLSIGQKLSCLVTLQVTVWSGFGEERNSFDTAISVCGKLEQHPETGQFRVVVEDGIYAYFDEDDVVEITQGPDGHRFQDGSIAIIRITMGGPE